jgi:3-phenylpropionate/trans-cinnamate dioxygenase ferredoxin reductase component
MRSIVIVGASLAGLRAAQAVRAAGFTGELTIVGDEPRMPYTRPPLSKELLAGEHDLPRCDFDCSEVEARWSLGTPATNLDVAAREVGLATGERLSFDRVILATGCRARTWSGPGAGLEGLYTLRSLDDAVTLREALLAGRHLVVVGAGFVGCEVAATAIKLGLAVTVVDIAEQPLVPLGPLVGGRCHDLHAAHGITWRLGSGISRFRGGPRVEAVELTDGTLIEADLAVVALGAVPNSDWLAGSGLAFERGGVLCDPTLTATSCPDVLCAGDIVAWPHPLAAGAVVRVEHWTNAAEQGAAAGRNALLSPEERASYVAVPYFWSDQFDVKLQAVGFPTLADEIHEVEREEGRFVAVGSVDDRAISAITWNAPRRLAVYRRALAGAPSLDDLLAQIAADPKALGAAEGAKA